MRPRQSFLLAGLVAAALVPTSASAAGVALSSSTGERVDVGHDTIASFSAVGTTVVEQLQYDEDGDGSVLWVLAVPQNSEIVFSSDALINMFDLALGVVVRQPLNNCFISSNECSGVSVGGGVGGSPGTIAPVADGVGTPASISGVSTLPDLEVWLAGFGVNPDADVVASFQAADAAGYGFVMVELDELVGLASSPALRITSGAVDGVVPVLAPSPDAEINLTLIGERRFVVTAQPVVTIEEKDLEWSWTTMESNYYPLAGDAIAAGWLSEAGEPLSPYAFDGLIELAGVDPTQSGYALAGLDTVAAAQADADALRAGLKAGSTWVSRLTTRVPAVGLPLELRLEPMDSISVVDRDLTPATETGAIPSCENDSGGCGDDFIGDDMDMGDDVVDCSATRAPTTGRSPLLLLAALLLGLARKRRLPKG